MSALVQLVEAKAAAVNRRAVRGRRCGGQAGCPDPVTEVIDKDKEILMNRIRAFLISSGMAAVSSLMFVLTPGVASAADTAPAAGARSATTVTMADAADSGTHASTSKVAACGGFAGYGTSTGRADCPGEFFKVRVWCTWAGGGLSDFYEWNHNSARCNRGSVQQIEIQFA